MDEPSRKSLQRLVNDPTLRKVQALADSPALKTLRDAHSPALRAIQEALGGSTLRTIRDIQSGPAMRTMQEVAKAARGPMVSDVHISPSIGLDPARFLPTTGGRAEAPAETRIATAADLGELIRQARLHQSLSQQAFADMAGVGRRFLSELENGKPTLELNKALAVCNAAGIDLLARFR
jgi:y4mF family transcriptional regulator